LLQPLSGHLVLDFSTLLPGPMATLLLAEAGAEVVKVERPGAGEHMRAYTPPASARKASASPCSTAASGALRST